MPGRIRFAEPSDSAVLLQLISELADYEKMLDQIVADEALLKSQLFAVPPVAEALVAETAGGEVVGFALFFHNFSTFLGRKGLYLEDIYVRPPYRGQGYGKALFARLVETAHARGCGRMEWAVLDWNQSAIKFYESFGAQVKPEWKLFRLTAENMAEFVNPTKREDAF